MAKTTVILFVCIGALSVCSAKNILLMQCVLTASYSNTFEAIAQSLAGEHNITLINRFKLNQPHPNITLLQFRDIHMNVRKLFRNLYINARNGRDTNQFGVEVVLIDSKQYVDEIMDDPVVKYVFQTRGLYDLLIIPSNLCGPYMKFAHYLNVPLVQVASSYPTSWQNHAIGNQVHLSTDPSLLLAPESDNFYGRLRKYLQGLKLLHRYYNRYLPNLERLSNGYFPPNTPDLEAISLNTSLLLVNVQDTLVTTYPKVPNFVEIGGIHCRPAGKLPNDLEVFVQSAEAGVIYLSFGGTVDTTFPEDIMRSILNVFGKLPQKVILKTGLEVEDVPPNVLILKVSPQQDILGHPNVKLFIMQGGMLSLQEAVFHEVPVLVLPLTLDQPTTAVLVEQFGYGRYLSFAQFSEETFFQSVTEMTSNPKYRKRIRELSALSKDVPRDTKEHLKWSINFVLRHKEPKSHGIGFSFIYHIDSDILIFFCFLCGSLIAVLWLLLRRCLYKYKKIKLE